MRFTRAIVTFEVDIVSIGAFLNLYSGFWTQLFFGRPAFVEDQALHIVGQISEHVLGLGTFYPDGTDEQPHMCLLLRKTCSTLARIFDWARLAARSASDLGLPFGFLRWIRLTRPLAASQASLVLDR